MLSSSPSEADSEHSRLTGVADEKGTGWDVRALLGMETATEEAQAHLLEAGRPRGPSQPRS